MTLHVMTVKKIWLYFEIKKNTGMYWTEEPFLILQVLISAATEKKKKEQWCKWNRDNW